MSYTRKQYMAHECTHREYYAQFVGSALVASVAVAIGPKRLLASTDAHLNDIPLKLWDDLRVPYSGKLRKLGDFPTLAGAVCINKEAARQYIEGARS